MPGQSTFSVGFSPNSALTWFVVAIALIVFALTWSTRRGSARPRSETGVQAPAPPPAAPAAKTTSTADAWAAAQVRFVDDPRAGLDLAHAIVDGAMSERRNARSGLPPMSSADRYQRASHVAANAGATTEERRQAFIDFRRVLDELYPPR